MAPPHEANQIPIYKTFKGYKYGHIHFPPLFNREELESASSSESTSPWQHQIQHLLLQQQEQAEKKPSTSPVSPKQNSSAQEPNVQFVELPSATSTESPTSLELRCGPVRLTVTEATSSELLKRMLCVLRDVFPAC